MDKREFIKQVGLWSVGAFSGFERLDSLVKSIEHKSAVEVAEDEEFWLGIRSGYRLKPDYINLENGYYCIVPQEILENLIHHTREINYQGSYYMRSVQWDNKRAMCTKLALIAGCKADEIIITRNTTESLDTVIQGIGWSAGDEAVMAEQDYGAMLDMFKLQAQRHGMINRLVSIPNHPLSDDQIVHLYASVITEKTRLLMVCHMINITGQILPIRKICDMAHSKGVEVMVDGAHAFGHFNFSIEDLACDYYGTSLHKWLSAPLGCGMLYVRQDKIAGLWQMYGEQGKKPNDIRRLNHTGTHPVQHDLAIGNAIEYLNRIGLARKEARLRHLQNYWTNKVRHLPHIVINTPADPHRSCGIANVGIKHLKPAELADSLLQRYRIWTVAIDGANVHGCRISPNIYTTKEELDIFVAALQDMKNM
ncbi:MAG: aminotransferase class V-fold PLP-dependent enzyme [Saprospiraceae bacterium]|nr:aminotransferase class V-fold PLP-dependent enzyme [Saprospiraceae bacterium]